MKDLSEEAVRPSFKNFGDKLADTARQAKENKCYMSW